jgi:hypothetical protein
VFSSALQTNALKEPGLIHQRFLPNPFQFIHLLSYHRTLIYCLNTEITSVPNLRKTNFRYLSCLLTACCVTEWTGVTQ